MRLVAHPNVVDLKAFFYSNGDKVSCVLQGTVASSSSADGVQKDEVYLNLVLEFVPETVYRASRHYSKLKQAMPMLQVKLYMYQVSPTLHFLFISQYLVALYTAKDIAPPVPRIHPFSRDMPPRYQTPEPAPQPSHGYSEIVRFRFCQNTHCGRAER